MAMANVAQRQHLLAFDVDGTLTKITSSWQFFHERLGTWERAKGFVRAYRDGGISFSKWAELDFALWRGLPFRLFERLAQEIPLIDDAQQAIRSVREKGFIVGTISSGVPFVSERIKTEMKMDFSIAQSFGHKAGVLDSISTPVTPKNKHLHLQSLAKAYGISLDRTVAVGDNWVDAEMIKIAGLGIAFNPKDDTIRAAAQCVLSGDSLETVAQEVVRWHQSLAV